MASLSFLLLARRGIGRAIGNLIEGVSAGETWAIVTVAVIGLVVVAFIALKLYQASQEAAYQDDDFELTAEEQELLNR